MTSMNRIEFETLVAEALDSLPDEIQAWLDNVDRALAEHDSSFAMLPMHYLLKADGMLEKLAARGYVIEAP